MAHHNASTRSHAVFRGKREGKMEKSGGLLRCPKCKKIGSAKLGGFCKNCNPANKTWEEDRVPLVRNYYNRETPFRTEPFVGGSYGIVKDKFEINPRY